jgi:hypothetical protein
MHTALGLIPSTTTTSTNSKIFKLVKLEMKMGHYYHPYRNRKDYKRILGTTVYQLSSLEETYKFLKVHSPPKVNQAEIENVNR